MKTETMDRGGLLLNVFIGMFVMFMFLPLVLLVLAAFNSTSPPSVTNWQELTLAWFPRLLEERRLIGCLQNSFRIAVFVVPASVLLGLSAAILLTRLEGRATNLLYAFLISPMLTPGIVLGIATIVFWRNFGVAADLFTTIIAQTTFIASFPMLIIMARLQRQDRFQEEAALDLGASSFFLFRRVTLPFLLPAILTSAGLAFLMSFENYNTTVFSIGGSCTLTTEIAAQARKAHTPVINALGVIFVAVTVIFSVIYTLRKQWGKKTA